MLIYTVLLFTVLSTCTAGGDEGIFDLKVLKPQWKKCKVSDKLPEAANLDKKWFLEQSKKGWFFVMAHKWAVIHGTEAFQGSAPKTLDDIKKGCFAKQFTKKGFLVSAFGKKHEVSCPKDEHGNMNLHHCTLTHGIVDKMYSKKHGTSDPIIIWTDNKKCILGVRCLNNIAVWGLLCNENKDVDPKMKKMVLKKIVDAGCRAEDAVVINRKGCPSAVGGSAKSSGEKGSKESGSKESGSEESGSEESGSEESEEPEEDDK